MSPSSSKENINTDYLYNEKVKGKRFASDSSSHEFLPKRSRYRSGSFSSGSEPDTQDSDRSRKAYHSRCSEPMYKLPCFKRSLCSSHFTAPVSPLKQKNGPINGTYLPSSTSQSEYFDSGTLCLKLKDNEMSVSQKSFGDLDKDSSSELLHANPDCIKIAYCKNSNADESRKNLIDETPLSSGESVTCKSNTVRNFEKYQCFTIEQEGCFNFLSDNCEKKESPVKFGAEISTSPRHLYRHPLLNSPSYFLVTDALVTASASSQSSSPVYHNTKIDCKTFEDLKELNMQDKVPSHSNSKFLPLTLDISSPLKEDVACGNSKIFDELQCVPQGEKTLLVSSHTNISMQESDTPTKGLHIPILSTTSEQSPAVSRVWSLAPGLQDLESKTPSCTLIPTKRLSSSSPSQPSLPELLKPGSSKQDFVTSIQKSYKMRDMVPSKTGALGFDGLKSFITPEGRSYVYPLGAPRKISKPTSRQQPPRCKRSLVRQFASDVTTVFNTPPDSPARLVGDLLPEMESDSEI
ncbi:uncharacterized protein LOC121857141 [Homarus americanus]|uniref:uncharacterized protein LOC121857141 n=1 Tax=Homarus americanus TaxID=6706 RepID=UPI001C488A5D|nr:uncharacterized protein LOC121857141 [Homarus americanus]